VSVIWRKPVLTYACRQCYFIDGFGEFGEFDQSVLEIRVRIRVRLRVALAFFTENNENDRAPYLPRISRKGTSC